MASASTDDVGQALSSIPVREPFPAELNFFRQNKTIAGMAADDDHVILNPYTTLSKKELQSVQTNEKVRVWLRQNKVEPSFQLTPEQEKAFKAYGSPLDIQHTIVGRALSGDPSAGKLTSEQQSWVEQIRNDILSANY